MAKKLLLYDNFDSFTHILSDYLHQLGLNVIIRDNSQQIKDLEGLDFNGIVISPGPSIPHKSGYLMDIIDHYHNKLPILGICLGHQALGQYFGAKLDRSIKPRHGKTSIIKTECPIMFGNLDTFQQVTHYHSLIIKDLPKNIITTATTNQNENMAFRHQKLPVWGFQFHPEAYLTTNGLLMLKQWASIHSLNT